MHHILVLRSLHRWSPYPIFQTVDFLIYPTLNWPFFKDSMWWINNSPWLPSIGPFSYLNPHGPIRLGLPRFDLGSGLDFKTWLEFRSEMKYYKHKYIYCMIYSTCPIYTNLYRSSKFYTNQRQTKTQKVE